MIKEQHDEAVKLWAARPGQTPLSTPKSSRDQSLPPEQSTIPSSKQNPASTPEMPINLNKNPTKSKPFIPLQSEPPSPHPSSIQFKAKPFPMDVTKVLQERRDHSHLEFPSRHSSRSSSPWEIDCDYCGTELQKPVNDEGPTIQCELCFKWQHVQCLLSACALPDDYKDGYNLETFAWICWKCNDEENEMWRDD